MLGIIDCNNFFVSCERVFQPRLKGRAVVVLSNNDGCIVARSNEAKAMGIAMGTPYFKVRHLVDSGQLQVRSGNMTLYGDMSRRVMSLVRKNVPRIEQYSIDECFMDLDGIDDPTGFGRALSAKVEKCTGIPVSIGIAPTKTLAKVGSKFAKKYAGYQHCCVIDTPEKRLKATQLTAIGDVWGIGRRMLATLTAMGKKTAYDFTQMKESNVRKAFSLPAVYTWRELQGMPCIPLLTPAAKQSITTSRSFKQPIADIEQMHALLADFASLSATKLRHEGSAARTVTVFLRTDRFRPDLPQYANAATLHLEVATADLRELAAASKRLLESIWLPHYTYKKAGIILTNIEHGYVQRALFDPVDRDKQERLLATIDNIQLRMGRDSIRVASQGSFKEAMNSQFRSPDYTTSLDDIIEVK